MFMQHNIHKLAETTCSDTNINITIVYKVKRNSTYYFTVIFFCVSATALTIIISLAACIGLMMLIVGMFILKR